MQLNSIVRSNNPPRNTIVLISMMLMAVAVGCAYADDTDELQAENKNVLELTSFDFSADWENQVMIDYPGSSERNDRIIGIKAAHCKTYHPDDDDLLGIKMVGDDVLWTTDILLSRIATHLARNGSLPDNAIELFPELNSPEGIAKFNSMYPTQRIAKYGFAVNYATRRFYSDLKDPTWRAGGIYIDVLDQNNEGRFLHDGAAIIFGEPGNPEPVDGACYYKVFSAAEDQVLYEDFFTYSTCQVE